MIEQQPHVVYVQQVDFCRLQQEAQSGLLRLPPQSGSFYLLIPLVTDEKSRGTSFSLFSNVFGLLLTTYYYPVCSWRA
jgi:hypothetical protein